MAYSWDTNLAQTIEKVVVSGSTYYIKDAEARKAINELSAYTEFLGVADSAITDGSTTNPVTISEESVTAKTGDIVIYASKEFIWNGTAWAEFGDLSALSSQLGTLAYVNEAQGNYTPEGIISVTGSFTGKEDTVTVSGSTTGGITVVSSSESGNYTPLGTINTDLKTTSYEVVYSATQGTPAAFTGTLYTPTVSYATVSGASVGTLVFTSSSSGDVFTANTLPTFSTSEVINSVTSSNPTFTGTKADITFAPSSITLSGSFTPELSTVPTYTFVGSSSTITVAPSTSE